MLQEPQDPQCLMLMYGSQDNDMYVLDSVNKSLLVNLDTTVTTANLVFTTHYADTSSSVDVVEGSNDGTINGSANVTIVAAPTVGKRRLVTFVTVFNPDSLSANVNLKYNNNGTHRQIAKIVLQPGETWYGD